MKAKAIILAFLSLSSIISTGQENCKLLGTFYFNVTQPDSIFNFSFFSPRDTSSLRQILQNAQANGFKVVINLSGPRYTFQDSNGHFSLDSFQKRLLRFSSFDFTPFDSVVFCHLLFDEPHDPTNWGGTTVSYDLIDSAAMISKTLFPSIPTCMGAPATWLANTPNPYRYLDYAKPQYSINKGNVDSFLSNNSIAAQSVNLKLFYSMNVLSGWFNNQPIPASALETLSVKIISDPLADGLLYWKYDSAYFNNTAVKQALSDIKKVLCTPTAVIHPSLNDSNTKQIIKTLSGIAIIEFQSDRWTITYMDYTGRIVRKVDAKPHPSYFYKLKLVVRYPNSLHKFLHRKPLETQ